jgi:hypothetical protein
VWFGFTLPGRAEMGEVRKADIVVGVRRNDGHTRKVELFSSRQFPVKEFKNTSGEEIILNQRGWYFRVRIDGVWFPVGVKLFLAKTECDELIKQAVFE